MIILFLALNTSLLKYLEFGGNNFELINTKINI